MSEKVSMDTSLGEIVIALDSEKAPETVKNFLQYVDSGFYDGTIFHRVITGFMLQGGDPTGTGRGGQSIWGKPFEDEVHANVGFDKAGILAMANAGPGTNGSQFFITTKPTPWLNMKHTIFGYVTDGMDVVTEIENVEKGAADRPVEDVQIIEAYMKW